jgi:DNA-binding transcriptional ArsR family regulator
VTTYGVEAIAALGDGTRRAVFEALAGGPCAVGELAGRLPVSRPAVSQHLRVLKDAGLVLDRAEGNRRIYRLDPRGIEALRDYFDGFWSDALAAYARAVDEDDGDGPQGRPGEEDQ